MEKEQERLKKVNSSDKSVIALFGIYCLVILISPYQRGLYFPEDFYWVGLCIQVLFLLTILLRFSNVKEMIGNNVFSTLLLLAIPLVYSLTYFTSASPYYAANESLKWFTYVVVFFVLAIWFRINKKLTEVLWIILWITMAWIIGLVFLVDLGRLEFTDALIGNRFSSVFQYPNTLASIVSAFIIAGIVGLTKRISLSYQIIYGFTLIPFTVAFLLTESRGGFLVFIAAWILGLLFLSWKEQILYIAYTVGTLLISFWGFNRYQGYIEAEVMSKASFILFIPSVLFTVFILVFHHFVYRRFSLSSRSKLNLIIPTGLMASGLFVVLSLGTAIKDRIILLFPEAIQTRISQITLTENSVQTRILFYKDAFNVWQDHFLIGAGGGGWRALFESYKSLPYHSTQAHSFYMQTLVEVGFIGSLFVFFFFIYIMIKGISTYFSREEQDQKFILGPALLMVMTMLLHNFIDFNMSYGTYNIFLFSLFAFIWSLSKKKESNKAVLNNLFHHLSYKQKNIIISSLMGILIISSCVGIYKSYSFVKAESLYKQVSQGGGYEVLSSQIHHAISLHSTNPKLREFKMDILNWAYQERKNNDDLENIEEEFQQLLQIAPSNANYYIDYAQLLWDRHDHEESVKLLDRALEIAPWNQELYEQNITKRLDLMNQYREQGINEEKVREHIKKFKTILMQHEEKMRVQSEDVPEGLILSNRIMLNTEYRIFLGRAFYYLGQHEQSLDYIKGINISKVDPDKQDFVMILRLMNHKQLENEEQVQNLLESEMAQKINIKQTYDMVKDEPLWQPFHEG